MAKNDPEIAALNEQLADAQAQIDSLQGQAADAEARAATARSELGDAQQRLSEMEEALQAANAELAARDERLAALQDELREAQATLREAALKYREARLAASPHVPADLVPGETLSEIDEQFEAAERVVSRLRDKLQEESQASRVPVGSPLRRPPDLSALSPQEKIKLGLQERPR